MDSESTDQPYCASILAPQQIIESTVHTYIVTKYAAFSDVLKTFESFSHIQHMRYYTLIRSCGLVVLSWKMPRLYTTSVTGTKAASIEIHAQIHYNYLKHSILS